MKRIFTYGSLLIMMVILMGGLGLEVARAVSEGWLNTTVKISVCGNNIKESGEECDRTDLGGSTCSSFGYTGGNLRCDISCSYDVSGCYVPKVNSLNVSPAEVSSLLAAGIFSKPPADSITAPSALIVNTPVTIVVPEAEGNNSISLPQGVTITRKDGGALAATGLAVAEVINGTASGLPDSRVVKGALMWGMAGQTLQFSSPITLNIYVGILMNGQTLKIYRSSNLSSLWTIEGIVAPAECVVEGGICKFQAVEASYFTATSQTPQSVSGTASNSSTAKTETAATISPTTATDIKTVKTPGSILPFGLSAFDLDGNGRIEKYELYGAVKSWVSDWRGWLTTIAISNGKAPEKQTERNCDINHDGECDLKDLSILLYYIER